MPHHPVKTLFITLFFLGCLHYTGYSQYSAYDLASYHMRYWKARGRLVGDEYNRDQHNGFMVVGDKPGMSIPFYYL